MVSHTILLEISFHCSFESQLEFIYLSACLLVCVLFPLLLRISIQSITNILFWVKRKSQSVLVSRFFYAPTPCLDHAISMFDLFTKTLDNSRESS